MTTIISANTKTEYTIIENLANSIWVEHYTPIIGELQVAYMLEKFQSAIAIEDQVEKGIWYYIIQYRDTNVGYFSFSKSEDFLFLSKLYILNSVRGKGIGRIAFSFIESKARELDLKKIKLTVNKYNTDSIEVYKKMGFQTIEAIIQDIGNGYIMDDYVLEKVIK